MEGGRVDKKTERYILALSLIYSLVLQFSLCAGVIILLMLTEHLHHLQAVGLSSFYF